MYYSYYSGNLSNTVLAKGRPVINISATNSFTFPKGLSAELSMNYQSAMVWGFYDLLPYGSVNVGVQKSIMKKNATIKAGFTDIFLTGTSGATIVFNNFSETWSAIRDTRVGNITFIYRIGKSSGFKKHGGGAEEEQRRAGRAG